MSARDELANLIASVTIDTNSGDVLRVHPDGETPVFEGDQKTADAILAAGYSKPRTITTAEELDALPVGTAVIGTAVHHASFAGAPYLKLANGEWWDYGNTYSVGSDDINVPATVTYAPGNPQP